MKFTDQTNVPPKRYSKSVTPHQTGQYDHLQIREQRRYAVELPENAPAEQRALPRLLLRIVSFLISKG